MARIAIQELTLFSRTVVWQLLFLCKFTKPPQSISLKRCFFKVASYSVCTHSFFCFFAYAFAHSVSLNEAERVNNGKTATEDPPPAKKIRKCQKMKKEPVAGGKADNDRTENKQGQLLDIHRPGSSWASKGSLGGVRVGGWYLVFSTLISSFLEDIINFLSFGHTTGLNYFLKIFSFLYLRWTETWADQECLGRAKLIMTGFCLTLTDNFDSQRSRCGTYLSSLRVCKDLAVKGQSSSGPRVHSQGGEGERLPLISQGAVVRLLLGFLSGTLLVSILGMLCKILLVINSLQGWVTAGVGFGGNHQGDFWHG